MTTHLRRMFTCLAAAALFFPSIARADEPAPPGAAVADDGAKTVDRVWYGWQPLIGDAASTAALVLSTSTDTGVVGVAGLSGYLFTSPAIHFAHGHEGKAVLSFALRAVLPLAGYGIAAAAAPSDPGHTRGLLGIESSSSLLPAQASVGFVFGALAAAIVDDTAIAREDVLRERPVAQVSWQPTVAPSARGAVLGVGGTF